MTKTAKVPVSTRAVIQRINRRLKADDEMLKKSRGAGAQSSLGDYYVLNTRYNVIGGPGACHIDPEDLARKLEVLKAYEVVKDGP